MADLTTQACIPCRAGTPPASDDEIEALRAEVPDWQIVERDGIKCLERVFRFKNFAEALAFTDRVGVLAEAEGHHPALLTEWGRVSVTWWTHKIKGLHRNDFVAAAKTDGVAAALTADTGERLSAPDAPGGHGG